MRLELGITGQLFKAPLILQDMITDSWMKSTWIATREADIHPMIHIPNFPLQQHGDRELVWVFLQHRFCQPQLGALHWCRMFLQVLRISDICTGSGEQLLMGNWQNYKPLLSEYQWPKAVKPSPADWNMWELASPSNSPQYWMPADTTPTVRQLLPQDTEGLVFRTRGKCTMVLLWQQVAPPQ